MSLGSKLDSLLSTPFPNLDKDDVAGALGIVTKCSTEEKIKQELKGLSDEQCDVLMKVLYKGLETGKNSNTLFKWHEWLCEKTGPGCIVRTLTDRAPADDADEDDE